MNAAHYLSLSYNHWVMNEDDSNTDQKCKYAFLKYLQLIFPFGLELQEIKLLIVLVSLADLQI